MSVDPDVASTGQPYAFTGDDPLNATDPLGQDTIEEDGGGAGGAGEYFGYGGGASGGGGGGGASGWVRVDGNVWVNDDEGNGDIVYSKSDPGDDGLPGAKAGTIMNNTVYKDSSFHIDVENQKPGQRPASLHIQEYSYRGGNKYQYNFETGKFEGLPRSMAKALARNRRALAAIAHALKLLGESK